MSGGEEGSEEGMQQGKGIFMFRRFFYAGCCHGQLAWAVDVPAPLARHCVEVAAPDFAVLRAPGRGRPRMLGGHLTQPLARGRAQQTVRPFDDSSRHARVFLEAFDFFLPRLNSIFASKFVDYIFVDYTSKFG